MARRNYFEILGLEFDPPEKNARRIEKAIEEWEKRINDRIANASDGKEQAELRNELALKSDMQAVLKDNKSKNLEAKALKDIRINQLEQLIDIMKTGQTGTPVVTNAMIRNVQGKLKLQQSTIETVYQKKGFEVMKAQRSTLYKDAFLIETVTDRVDKALNELRKLKSDKYPWTSKVEDLYDFICYFQGDSDSERQNYRKKRTAELHDLMQSWSVTYANDMSTQGHLLNDLFSIGSSSIFDSEVNRKKYDQTIERAKLSSFFSLLISAPEDFKRDRYFADSCIHTIQKHFPDYNLALAIYNQHAGLLKDPYEPIEPLIHVTCGVCKTPAEFRSREEAENGKCPACGSPLYIKCPSCGRKVPSSADRCACGFMISEMRFFDDYVRAARFALKEMDLAEARKQLENAKNAYPGNPQLAALETEVKSASDKYQKPLDELNALIGASNYFKANDRLAKIAASMPKLRLDSQRKTIDQKLKEAASKMPAPHLSDAEKANRYVDILNIVKDYQPAIDGLQMLKPGAVKNLKCGISGTSKLTCSISWSSSGDRGVTYTVVRKQGVIPKNHADGEVLASEITALEFKDTGIQPGILYGYAVFAGRRGAYSEPAGITVASFAELDASKVTYSAENGVCRFTWIQPANCIGVRILRRENGIAASSPGNGTTVVKDLASGSFNDTNVKNNVTYGYRLQCVYSFNNSYKYSDGITRSLMPEPAPVSVRGVNAKTEGRLVTVTWNNPDRVQRQVILKSVDYKSASKLTGNVLPVSEINSITSGGTVYATVSSNDGTASFQIPSNTALAIAVICQAGSRGIICDLVRVSSVEKCEIDRARTQILGSRLLLRIKKKPEYLTRIHYLAARKTDTAVPWAKTEDAAHRMLSSVSVREYDDDGMIAVDQLPQTDIYISVIGEYKMPDGTTVYSEPSKLKISNKPKAVIRYDIIKESTGGFFKSSKVTKLVIRCSAEETPELYLAYKTDGHIPMKLEDPKVVKIHTISETDEGFPGGEYVWQIPDDVLSRMPARTEIRLFMRQEDMISFTLEPVNIGNLKVN
jgi:hypothetical protein